MITSYIAFAILVIALAIRIGRVALLPTPLRWEIYPVPHEEPEKVEHGGSYYEDPGWWKVSRHLWHLNEWKEVLKEMLFMIRLFENNRRLWWVSYPFHGGIYLILAWFALLVIGALTEIAGLPIQTTVTQYPQTIPFLRLGNIIPYPHAWSILIYVLTVGAGYLGATAILYGCFGLIILRLKDPALRTYAKKSDFFNLFFIMAVVISGFVAAGYDPHFIIAREYMKALLLGGFALPGPEKFIAAYGYTGIPTAVTVHLLILEAFLVYYPFTKMIHGPLKYISYHKIAWDNMPRIPGIRLPLDVKINKYLDYIMTWEGPHAPKGHKWRDLRSVWPEVSKS